MKLGLQEIRALSKIDIGIVPINIKELYERNKEIAKWIIPNIRLRIDTTKVGGDEVAIATGRPNGSRTLIRIMKVM